MFSIPFEPIIAGVKINIHLILEYAAFFVAYRYYSFLKKHKDDPIPDINRLYIIAGASLGALIGSRVIGFLENPVISSPGFSFFQLYNTKTIMGGLFGGLMGVELTKKLINEKSSSGDLFTLPIIAGLFIGRVGCFLSGTNEFTYGSVTNVPWAMNLGDGLLRHPITLYELVFLIALYVLLYRLYQKQQLPSGDLFKIFMLCYFGFRFLIEFIKPNVFFLIGLSSIQWLCIVCFVYYYRTLQFYFRAR